MKATKLRWTWKAWVLCGAALYGILPLDVVPDVVPVVGWLDDVAVGAGAIALVLREGRSTLHGSKPATHFLQRLARLTWVTARHS